MPIEPHRVDSSTDSPILDRSSTTLETTVGIMAPIPLRQELKSQIAPRAGRNTASIRIILSLIHIYAKSPTMPKHASIADYRHATAFEALLGYLYLAGEIQRAEALMKKAFEYTDKEEPNATGQA